VVQCPDPPGQLALPSCRNHTWADRRAQCPATPACFSGRNRMEFHVHRRGTMLALGDGMGQVAPNREQTTNRRTDYASHSVPAVLMQVPGVGPTDLLFLKPEDDTRKAK